MKLLGKRTTRLAGFVAATAVRCLMRTLDYQVAYYDSSVDPVDPRYHGQKIYVFWHENILMPLYLRGHCQMAMLLSKHRDADILAEVGGRLGFDFIRGSTFAGGGAALMEMLRLGMRTNLAMTPDGPRGPRRQLAQGPIYLASRSGMPLVCMGLGYDRPWRASSWDRFAIPRPGSRARGVISPAIKIPTNLDRDGVEHYRLRMEQLLNRLTDEATAWATSGTAKLGQLPARPQRAYQAA